MLRRHRDGAAPAAHDGLRCVAPTCARRCRSRRRATCSSGFGGGRRRWSADGSSSGFVFLLCVADGRSPPLGGLLGVAMLQEERTAAGGAMNISLPPWLTRRNHPQRSPICSRKIAAFRLRRSSARTAQRQRRRCLRARRRDPEAFWASLCLASSSGSRPGRRSSTGSRRTRSGSSAARSTRASTASTGTCAARAATRPRSIWEGEPGDRRTLTYFDLYRQVGAVRQRPASRSACKAAIASRSTCR